MNSQPEKVLICERESDIWTALSYGFAAVRSQGAKNFKAAWTESFRGLQDAEGQGLSGHRRGQGRGRRVAGHH
jgi:hypothetical protein